MVIATDARLVVRAGQPLPGNRNDCMARKLSGVKVAVGLPRISDEAGQRKRAARVDDDLGGPDVQCACQDRAL
jgi:hypothetical protein